VEAPLCALPLMKAREYFEGIVPGLLADIAQAIVTAEVRAEGASLPPLLDAVCRQAEQTVRSVGGDGTLSPKAAVANAPTASAKQIQRVRPQNPLRLNEVMPVLRKYRIAPSEKMPVEDFVRKWVEAMNQEGAAHPGLVNAIRAGFREADPPLQLVAARPKDLGWVKEVLNEIAQSARLELGNVD
jgi:hypothetical protein